MVDIVQHPDTSGRFRDWREEHSRGANELVGSGLSWNETLQFVDPVLDHHQLHG